MSAENSQIFTSSFINSKKYLTNFAFCLLSHCKCCWPGAHDPISDFYSSFDSFLFHVQNPSSNKSYWFYLKSYPISNHSHLPGLTTITCHSGFCNSFVTTYYSITPPLFKSSSDLHPTQWNPSSLQWLTRPSQLPCCPSNFISVALPYSFFSLATLLPYYPLNDTRLISGSKLFHLLVPLIWNALPPDVQAWIAPLFQGFAQMLLFQ